MVKNKYLTRQRCHMREEKKEWGSPLTVLRLMEAISRITAAICPQFALRFYLK